MLAVRTWLRPVTHGRNPPGSPTLVQVHSSNQKYTGDSSHFCAMMALLVTGSCSVFHLDSDCGARTTVRHLRKQTHVQNGLKARVRGDKSFTHTASCMYWLLPGPSIASSPSSVTGMRMAMSNGHRWLECAVPCDTLQTHRMLLGWLLSPSSASAITRMPPFAELRSNCSSATANTALVCPPPKGKMVTCNVHVIGVNPEACNHHCVATWCCWMVLPSCCTRLI